MRRHCQDQEIIKLLTALERCERLDTFDLDEFFYQVDNKGQHVVFLLDEFEGVTENANFGPDFYYGFRSLMIHHKVALVTASRLELIELCHSEAVKSSPFFNIFANINLRLLSPADYELMISRSLNDTGTAFSKQEMEQILDLAGLHPYFLQAAAWMLFESHRMGMDMTARRNLLAERFRAEAVPQLADYWNHSGDNEKIVLTAAALLECVNCSLPGFSLEEMSKVFSRSEPCVEHLAKRGLLMPVGTRYRLFSSVFGPWIISQISAEHAEEQSYHEWLAANGGSVERLTGKHGGPLPEILPKIGARYRRLIIAWASDPQTSAAMAGLLNNVPAMVE